MAIIGTSKNDTLFGTSDEDLILGLAGKDLIDGESGNDTLIGGVNNDTLNSGAGNDLIDGSSGIDELNGGTGDDVLINTEGNVDGGGGTDFLIYDLSELSYGIEYHGTRGDSGIILGSIFSSYQNIEQLQVVGTDFGDYLGVGNINDILDGGAGNDLLYVLLYQETTAVDAEINFNNTNQISIDGAGLEVSNFEIFSHIYTGSGNDTLTATSSPMGSFISGDGDDLIELIGVDNVNRGHINSGNGDDTVRADFSFLNSSLDSTYIEMDPAEYIELGEAYRPENYNNFYYYSIEQFEITGTNFDDTLTGKELDDIFEGIDGEDILNGRKGNDTLFGGDGNDSLYGGSDNDLINGDNGNDLIIGGENNDRLIGSAGNDTLNGVNSTQASPGKDELDVVSGNARSDTFVLGDEDNVYYNQGGTESEGGQDRAIILDFNPLIDKIQLYGKSSDYQINSNASLSTINYIEPSSGVNELVAVIRNVTELDLTNTNQFSYTDNSELIIGTDDSELISGGESNQTIDGSGGDDQISGLGGDDTLNGGLGQDTVFGGNENDLVMGGENNDRLIGSTGNDTLNGVNSSQASPGKDELDVVSGNAGSDTFVLGDENNVYYNQGGTESEGGQDRMVILDFNPLVDKIQLHGTSSDYQINSNASLSTINYREPSSGVNELIAVVRNVSELDLTDSSQFDFV